MDGGRNVCTGLGTEGLINVICSTHAMDLDTAARLGLLERCVEVQLQLQLLQRHLKTAVSIEY